MHALTNDDLIKIIIGLALICVSAAFGIIYYIKVARKVSKEILGKGSIDFKKDVRQQENNGITLKAVEDNSKA